MLFNVVFLLLLKQKRTKTQVGVLSDVETKETPTRFLLYLGGKCFDLYKIKYSLLLLTRKHFIKCLSSIVKPIISQTCKHDVRIVISRKK